MISNTAKSLSSKHHYLHTLSSWKNSEADYTRALDFARISYTLATQKENRASHIDYWVDCPKNSPFAGRRVSVDIKGIKKGIAQGDITLEIKNVRGEDGWCSKSGPELIAFSFGLFFLHIPTTSLVSCVGRLCNLDAIAKDFKSMQYCGYSRNDRKDLLTSVKLHDILREEGPFWYLPIPPPQI